ncbi:MAG: surface lipoprotein assembly modifier, partial [Pseudomonadota bacterium]
ATTDETYQTPLLSEPFLLSDKARQQSGVGVNWSLGTTISPTLRPGIKGHFSAHGQVLDYPNADFDQGTGRLEAGFRRQNKNPRGIRTIVALTYEQQYFGGDPYGRRHGIRLGADRPVGQRSHLWVDLSTEQAAYPSNPDRDGWVYSLGVRGMRAMNQALRLGVQTGIVREDAEAASLSNTQYRFGATLLAALPWNTQIGVYPTIYFRQFDETGMLQFEPREDWTYDVATQLAKRNWQINGFYPGLVYRFTENQSSDSVQSYERHTMDVSFSKQF